MYVRAPQRDLCTPKSLRVKSGWGWAYLMIAPTVIGLLVLNIYPFIKTILLSLYKSEGLGAAKYVGLKNYVKMFADGQIWQSTWNTLYYMLLTVPIGVLIALILAVLLNSKIRGRDLYRGIYFMPMIVAPAAIAIERIAAKPSTRLPAPGAAT